MNIVVYGLPTCPKCEAVKGFLQSNNVPFTYQEVGKDIVKERLELVVSRIVRSVPVVTVDGREVSDPELRTLIQQ